MSDLKNIRGKSIQSLASDPANIPLGEIWYNSEEYSFKRKFVQNTYQILSCSQSYNGTSWTVGGAMATARHVLAGTGASNTAALAFGGNSGYERVTCTESYNGSSWTAGGALGTGRQGLAGAGTNTAALAFGGLADSGPPLCTESYNGTSWTAGGAVMQHIRERLANISNLSEKIVLEGITQW